jgi:hypothetical protein
MWQKITTSVNYKQKIWLESVFNKNNFESVYFSNKYDKSHIWLKKLKKMHFLATLAYDLGGLLWSKFGYILFD